MKPVARKALRFTVYVLFILLAALQTSAARAQTPTPPSDDAVNAIARELFCPICQNTPLDVCPTEACRQWRELIRQMLAEGKSEAEIKQFFVDNYGARVLSAPPAEGINWLAYIVPPVMFLGGALLLFQAFRTWKRTAEEPADGAAAGKRSAPAADDEYVSRLEAELKKRR
ncbi:MAG: cytochrome c-type bioproteinis protein CcmH [Anaerolineaceae bacterium]|nr:MAG: cytochrome c-type bioproteinis protein CcmH [Anaerolineaceae bacterium]